MDRKKKNTHQGKKKATPSGGKDSDSDLMPENKQLNKKREGTENQ